MDPLDLRRKNLKEPRLLAVLAAAAERFGWGKAKPGANRGFGIAGGKVLNARLSAYRVPRFGDVPALETVLLDRKDLPSTGAGETPIICVAPAVANAIADACGVRLRAMPMLKA